METLTVTIAPGDAGQRLDKALALLLPQLSRMRVQALVEAGHVLLAQTPAQDSSRKVKAGEVYTVRIPPAAEALPAAQAIALDVVFEDRDMLVINKPAGMVVHPAAGNPDGTLVNALLAHCGAELSGIGGVRRPGIVHRLDKETSGLLAVAKNDAAHRGLSAQLENRTLKRVYQAIVWGHVAAGVARIATQIGRSKANRQKMAVLRGGGKEAVTEYEMQESFALVASFVACRLQTGRTHQIRVHMAHLHHWLVGDPVYGYGAARKFLKARGAGDALSAALLSFPRQALHAARLEFVHPIGENAISLSAPLPDDMRNLLDTLRTLT